MRIVLILLIWLSLAISARATDPAPFIVVDQFGYLPELNKRAVIRDPQIGFDRDRQYRPGRTLAVIDVRSGRPVFKGPAMAWKNGEIDPASGDRIWHFDFSSVSTPGSYVIRDVDRRVDSDVFVISQDVYRTVLRDAFKAFYYQRAGFEKREPFARVGYVDGASHLGPGQDREATRYDAKGDLSTARDLRGGWYDAGDYNQYTSWTSNYVSSLLSSYIENRSAWTDDMGIPESGNGIPDILDEVLWGLEWLTRMQNEDGSMLSVLGRSEGSPPSAATGPSYYGSENTSSTVTASGAFAQAATVFRGVPQLRRKAREFDTRARRAWAWADANPNVKFYNNSDDHGSAGLAAGQQEVETKRLQKKTMIAAAQMFGMTGDITYSRRVRRLYDLVGGIDPSTANGFEGDLGFTLLHFANKQGVPADFSRRIRNDYEKAMRAYSGWGSEGDDGYNSYVDGYWWGSNSTKARRGSVYTQALVAGLHQADARRTKSRAADYLHYLHGVNPMGLVYLTNMDHAGAERSVSTLYHAWFKDGSEDFDSTKTSRFGPAPGHLVGGPNPGYSRDDCCPSQCGGYGNRICKRPILTPPSGQPPAKSYAEFNDPWPLNSWEVTENSLGYQISYLRLLSKFVD